MYNCNKSSVAVIIEVIPKAPVTAWGSVFFVNMFQTLSVIMTDLVKIQSSAFLQNFSGKVGGYLLRAGQCSFWDSPLQWSPPSWSHVFTCFWILAHFHFERNKKIYNNINILCIFILLYMSYIWQLYMTHGFSKGLSFSKRALVTCGTCAAHTWATKCCCLCTDKGSMWIPESTTTV